jgi:cyanophycinase-like exopeptidase
MIAECRIIAGTPDECVGLVTRAQELLGLTQLDCTFYFGGLSFEQARRSQHLFATQVMPRFFSHRHAAGLLAGTSQQGAAVLPRPLPNA